MSDGPFARLDSPAFGKPSEGFACVQCGEPSQAFMVLAIGEDKALGRAACMMAYGICQRCAALYWNEAGASAIEALRAFLKEIPEKSTS